MSEVQPAKVKKARQPRSNYWVLTVNNPTQQDYENVLSLVDKQIAKYVIVAREHHTPRPEQLPTEYSWTPHLQCYIQFFVRKETSNCQKIQKGAWFVAKGSSEANYIYCTKGDVLTSEQYPLMDKKWDNYQVGPPDFNVFGNPTEVSARSNVENCNDQKQDQLKQIIDTTETLEEVMRTHASVYCRNRNGLQDIYNLKYKDTGLIKIKPFIAWLAGPTGCGKSKIAHEISQWFKTDPWRSGDNLKWFDGLTPLTECVIIDDFRKSMCDFQWLLRLLDRYPLNCQVKGVKGGTFFNPKIIIITCPRTPSEEFVYRDKYQDGQKVEYEDVMQIIRRCDVIMEWVQSQDKWVHRDCSQERNSGINRFDDFQIAHNPNHLQVGSQSSIMRINELE